MRSTVCIRPVTSRRFAQKNRCEAWPSGFAPPVARNHHASCHVRYRVLPGLRRQVEQASKHHTDVPFDNNHAERTICNAMVMRKNSNCNRSVDGAATQAILMSAFQTLKQRNAHVTATIVKALRHFLTTKKLPTLKNVLENSAEMLHGFKVSKQVYCVRIPRYWFLYSFGDIPKLLRKYRLK